jgi:PhnB protein
MAELKGLIPHLVVKGGAAAIDFYKAAFGANELSRALNPGGDGRVFHAHLQINGHDMFLCDDFPEFAGGISRAPGETTPVTFHLVVPNADAAVAKAAAAGATVIMPADDMFWGDRYGKVRDPFGHEWSFSHPLTADQKAIAEQKWAAMMGGK